MVILHFPMMGSHRAYIFQGEAHFVKLGLIAYAVLVAEVLFIPFIVIYYHINHPDDYSPIRLVLSGLLYPGLVLIDHGHFQYNNISLGLCLFAVVLLCKKRDYLASAVFCLSLNYKQMELYHAVPFFCYLLGTSLKMSKYKCVKKLICLAAVVIATFGICWYPFLTKMDLVLQVLRRLFPFARGLFEDKVANFWCSLSVLVKVKQMFDSAALAKYSLYATMLGLLPSSIDLLSKPSLYKFKLALLNSALVFYLFSFQVHEKSILLAALPALLILDDHPIAASWFLMISTTSMFPLLVKDGLMTAFFASQLLYLLVTPRRVSDKNKSRDMVRFRPKLRKFFLVLMSLSNIGAISLCIAQVFSPPNKRYPDLYPVIISLYCFTHFILFLAYFHWAQYTYTDTPKDPKSPNPKNVKYGRGRTPKKDL